MSSCTQDFETNCRMRVENTKNWPLSWPTIYKAWFFAMLILVEVLRGHSSSRYSKWKSVYPNEIMSCTFTHNARLTGEIQRPLKNQFFLNRLDSDLFILFSLCMRNGINKVYRCGWFENRSAKIGADTRGNVKNVPILHHTNRLVWCKFIAVHTLTKYLLAIKKP